jgi:hypothetical protein
MVLDATGRRDKPSLYAPDKSDNQFSSLGTSHVFRDLLLYHRRALSAYSLLASEKPINTSGRITEIVKER